MRIRGWRRREEISFVVSREFAKADLAHQIPFENTIMYLRSRPWEVLDSR